MSLENLTGTIKNSIPWSSETSTTTEVPLNLDAFNQRMFLSDKVVLIFIAIVATLGNSLVLVVTWLDRSLHLPDKYFVAHLAFADILVGIFVAPLNSYTLQIYLSDQTGQISIHLCRFMEWIDNFALTSSIYTLTFISFDRYFKISKPFQYKSRMTTSKTLKSIFIILFISTTIATYGATPHSGSHGILETTAGACPTKAREGKEYETFLAVSSFFLPAVIIFLMYTLIFLVAHKRNKMLANGELGETINDQNQRTALRRDMKVVRMLLVVVGVFTLCWGPWIMYVFMWHNYEDFIDWDSNSTSYWHQIYLVSFISSTLPLFNSACNPIIYASLDQKYGEAFKRLFKKIVCWPSSSTRSPRTPSNELRPQRTR
ncbi:adenosine receptor A2b-like [Dendronephthya gigantea]|uniref:adenosine receptor A2b-like n=1 Tax=Dendronephthya gigantea TaxID=151771 RepID=UPI00106B309E|nr:adenosine receptor A2b-like [Dendronephthya gigantea]